MNFLQYTRNERNPCLKQSRPDRSYRDTLLSALLQINAHPLGHNVKQVPPSNKKTPFLSHFFKLVGMQGKLVSVATLFTTFYASSASESVQENSKFSVFSLSHARDKTKNIFLSFFAEHKTYHLFFPFTSYFKSSNSQNIYFLSSHRIARDEDKHLTIISDDSSSTRD